MVCSRAADAEESEKRAPARPANHKCNILIPWRDLPERYGPYTSAYNRFNRWSRRGVWKRPARSWPCGAASLSRAIYDAGCSFRTFAMASGPRRSSFGYEAKRRRRKWPSRPKFKPRRFNFSIFMTPDYGECAITKKVPVRGFPASCST